MALIHEMLYKSKNLSRIDFNEYVRNLVGSLFVTFHINVPKKLRPLFKLTDQPVSITTAIPLGLVINELLTNALKYAFPTERKGEIRILMTLDDNNDYTLIVSDNGIGLPENYDFETVNSLGLRLISILIKQLDGSMSFSNDDGAFFTFQFNRKDELTN